MGWREELHAHLERRYPEEGCGLVFARAGARRVVPVPNVYDAQRRRTPAAHPRTNRTAFEMDPLALTRLCAEAEAAGEGLELIFHSHCDAGAFFSAEDAAAAAPAGLPLYPGVGHLVVAVDRGRATGSRHFVWQGGCFVEKPSP